MQHTVGVTGVKGAGKDTFARHLQDLGYIRVGFADALYQEVAQAYGVTVEFIGHRDTKEKDLAPLALAYCSKRDFVEVVLPLLKCSRHLRRAILAYVDTGKVPVSAHVSKRRIKKVLNAGRSPRWTMQLWGTEYRRKSKYGVDSYWLDKVRDIINAQPERNFIITDVRFKNEAAFIEGIGGTLCRIRRPVLEEKEAKERSANGRAAHPSETEMLAYPVDVEVINVEGEPSSLKRGVQAVLDYAGPAERKAA